MEIHAQTVNTKSLDQIMASINGHLVTRNDLRFWLFEIRAQKQEFRALADDQLISKVLEDAIQEELLYRALWAGDLEPADKDVKEFLEVSYQSMVENYGSEDRLEEELRFWKLDLGELRLWLEERVKRDWVIQSAIAEQVHLTKEETEEASKKVDHQFQLREIYLYVTPGREGSEVTEADWRKAEYLLNDIRIDLNSGLSFSQAAKIYSQSATSLDGGNLGWIKESSLSDKLKEEVKFIRVGQTTRPIRFSDGFGLYKLDNKRTSSSIILSQIRQDLLHRALLDTLKTAEIDIHPDFPIPSLKLIGK